MSSKNLKWLIRVILLLILFGWVIGRPLYTAFLNQEHWSKREVMEYKELFNEDKQSKLVIFSTTESRLRSPESEYIYNNKYNVFVTSVVIPKKFDLRNDIIFKNEISRLDMGALRFPLRSYNCKIKIFSQEVPLIKQVKLKIDGTHFKLINSSTNQVSYYYELKTITLSFNDSSNYLFIGADKSNIPINITFLKKDSTLYIITVTISQGEESMPKDILYSILKK